MYNIYNMGKLCITRRTHKYMYILKKTSHDFFSKSNCRKHSVYIYNVIGKKTKLFMDFNYLEITFKNGTCK